MCVPAPCLVEKKLQRFDTIGRAEKFIVELCLCSLIWYIVWVILYDDGMGFTLIVTSLMTSKVIQRQFINNLQYL